MPMQPRPRADTVKPCWPSLRVGIGVLDILRSLSDLDYCIIKRPFREYGTSSDSLHLLWTSSCNDTRERSTMNQNGTSSPTAYSAFDWPGRRWHRPGLALDAGEACSHPCNDAGASAASQPAGMQGSGEPLTRSGKTSGAAPSTQSPGLCVHSQPSSCPYI